MRSVITLCKLCDIVSDLLTFFIGYALNNACRLQFIIHGNIGSIPDSFSGPVSMLFKPRQSGLVHER